MILDSKDNNNKDNRPLEMALEFYDNMSPHHWMIEEVRELLQDDRYSKSEGGSVKYRVPVEEFFTERRNRLLKYFTAILSRKVPVEEFFTERRNRLLKYFTAILSRKLNDEKIAICIGKIQQNIT